MKRPQKGSVGVLPGTVFKQQSKDSRAGRCTMAVERWPEQY